MPQRHFGLLEPVVRRCSVKKGVLKNFAAFTRKLFIEHLGGCFWVTGTTTSLKLHSPGGKYRSSFRTLLEFYPRNIITEIKKKEMTRPGKVTLLYTTIN